MGSGTRPFPLSRTFGTWLTQSNQTNGVRFAAGRGHAEPVAQRIIDPRESCYGGKATFSEQQLLEGFFQYVEKKRPRLVTFNGRSFDLPVLKYRAMLHGISAPWLNQGESRFENYGYRYISEWHCDLMDVMADYGASTSAKLDEVGRLFGFPGKFGIDGSKVAQIYAGGGIKDIRDYCETDALNTYLVYLRYALFRGSIDRGGYNKAIADVVAYIEGQRGQRPHFGEFQEAWTASSGGKLYLD